MKVAILTLIVDSSSMQMTVIWSVSYACTGHSRVESLILSPPISSGTHYKPSDLT